MNGAVLNTVLNYKSIVSGVREYCPWFLSHRGSIHNKQTLNIYHVL